LPLKKVHHGRKKNFLSKTGLMKAGKLPPPITYEKRRQNGKEKSGGWRSDRKEKALWGKKTLFGREGGPGGGGVAVGGGGQ